MTPRQRLTYAAIAVVIAAAAIIIAAASGGEDEPERAAATPTATATAEQGDEPSATPTPSPTPLVRVRGGEPVGGVQELEFDKGDRVVFRVRSDVTDHVHVHGYDLMKDVTPGRTIRFSFKATIDGIYEVELEDRGVEIASLRVNP